MALIMASSYVKYMYQSYDSLVHTTDISTPFQPLRKYNTLRAPI